MTTGGKDGGDAGSNGSEKKGGSGGGFPVCPQCGNRHRPEVRCWDPCSRCGLRHHRYAACPPGSAQQQQMAQLQEENRQMRAQLQHQSAYAQAYGYGALPPPPQLYPPYPSFPSQPWQPQQVVPAMGMGAFPYHGGHFPPMMPPPNAYAGGFAVGAPQGTPSDAFSRRKGGWRGGNRPETANKKDEKKKGKARDVLAADPSGVQKPGKHHDKNVKHRKKVQAEKQKKKEKGVQEGGEGEQEVEMSGVEDASNPGTQPSGPPQPVVQQQQVAENSSASVGAAPADGTLAPSASRQIPNLPRRLREGEEE